MKLIKWKWAKDKWEGEDKFLHFFISMLLAWILPWYVVIALGLLKEIIDAIRPNGSGFSYKDLVADMVGTFMGVLFVI